MLKSITTAASALVIVLLLHAWLAAAADQQLLEDITFEAPSELEERITFKLNGVYIPKIFALKGERPRVVFDFPDTKAVRLLNNIINTNGKFIKQIRIGIHHEPNPKTRVVFDLLPDKEIDFKQDFDTKKNALVISVYHAGAEPIRSQQKAEVAQDQPVQQEAALEPAETIKEQVPTEEAAAEQKPQGHVREQASPSAVAEARPELQETQISPEPTPAPVGQEEEVAAVTAEEVITQIPTAEEPALQAPEPVRLDADPQPVVQQEQHQAGEPPAAVEQTATIDTISPPLLSSVTFDNNTNRGEMVLFKLNEFHPPIVFGVEEGQPRVVCDFKETEAAKELPSSIKTDGKYVHTIRIGKEKNPKKVRVVLDLAANYSYDLQQVFFKDDNLFVIIINTLSKAPTTAELEKPLR